jgi:hypothetical protein
MSKVQKQRGGYGETLRSSFVRLLIIAGCSLALGGVAQGDEIDPLRERARKEVAPLFFGKFVSIDAALVDSSGPEKWRKLFGKPLVGCPRASFPSAETMNLELTTAGGGPWAGSLDGINVRVTSAAGSSGGGLAMPSNSTARVPNSEKGPAFSFFFNQTSNVERGVIDRAAREVDQCLSKLPAGRYEGDEISRLCPYPELPVANFRQTCVVDTYGDISDPLPDGSGYAVTVIEQLMCDGVGYGRAQPTSTAWLPCYTNTYRGVAEIKSGTGGARIAALRDAAKSALRRCSSNISGKSRRANRMGSCAAKSISHRLAKTVRRSGN